MAANNTVSQKKGKTELNACLLEDRLNCNMTFSLKPVYKIRLKSKLDNIKNRYGVNGRVHRVGVCKTHSYVNKYVGPRLTKSTKFIL